MFVASTAPAATERKPEKPAVLVVDDEYGPRESIAFTLGREFNVATADRGRLALEMIRETPYDTIILDIRMPEMDGIEATAHIRQHMQPPVQQVPVILLTANVNAQDHLRGLRAGINALMVKPFDRSKLCALIEEQLLSSATFLQRLAQER